MVLDLMIVAYATANKPVTIRTLKGFSLDSIVIRW
jgi:hypothetical protein